MFSVLKKMTEGPFIYKGQSYLFIVLAGMDMKAHWQLLACGGGCYGTKFFCHLCDITNDHRGDPSPVACEYCVAAKKPPGYCRHTQVVDKDEVNEIAEKRVEEIFCTAIVHWPTSSSNKKEIDDFLIRHLRVTPDEV
jgi:hypothetical protein